MPEEARFTCSAMTSQSLYYLGNENLKHKILSISEEEGVRDASYQLKLLQSEGRLSLVATGKESGTGRTATERYEVEGPVALLMTTTAQSIDPELLNRCMVVELMRASRKLLPFILNSVSMRPSKVTCGNRPATRSLPAIATLSACCVGCQCLTRMLVSYHS